MNQDQVTRGYCQMLDGCETLPRSQLKQQHDIMLERLCRHARNTTEFYADRLAPLFDQQDQFSLEAWSDIPPLTRRDLADNFDALKSNDVPENFGNTRLAQSSGSSGQPVKALWTDSQVIAANCIGRRLHNWHGIDPSEFLVLVYATPLEEGQFESEHDHWAPVYKSLGVAGRCVTINGQLPTQHIFNRLEELKPDHLNINPRLLFAIANEYLAQEKKPEYRLKSIGTFGETRTELIGDRIDLVFGVRPYARYTADEIGHIAIECPDCGTYHVAEEVIHADVVDNHLKPVGPGQTGRILTTPLYSYAMPLIRYELGDEVTLADGTCWRAQGTSIAQIDGRLGDLFHHPQGGRFRPNRAILNQLAHHLKAAAVQIVQQAPQRFVIRFQPTSTAPSRATIAILHQELEDSFGFKVTVDLVPVAEIPALANGKREDFVCAIAQ
ncbi:MAG: hypothetical protein ABJM29_21280 [Rhizobiaceae bacterium]